MTEILIIHLTRLGDLVQSNRLVMELKETIADCEIDFFALEEFAGALSGLPLRTVYTLSFDDLETLHRRIDEAGTTGLWSAGDTVFGEYEFPRYDRIVNLDYSRGAAWMTTRIAAAQRQGGQLNQNGDLYFPDDWSSYFHAVALQQSANLFNIVDLQRLAGGAGVAAGPDAHSWIDVAEELPFALPEGVQVAVNPGASESHRRWPLVQFVALMRRLHEAGVNCMLVGAEGDREACRTIAAQLDFPVHDFSGRTSIGEFALLLRKVGLLVSSDTGAVHIAAAVGTRTVGLYEHIPYLALTAPWSAGNVLLRSRLPQRSVEAGVVAAAVLERLGRITTEELRQQLQASPVEAWETRFLPEGCDPLGGLACLPLHREELSAARLFSLVLRHVLAWQFSGATGPLDIAWLSEAVRSGRQRLSAAISAEAAELADRVVTMVQHLDGIAALAHQGGMAAAVNDVERLSERAAGLTEALEHIPAIPAGQPGLQLVLTFLDQKLAATVRMPMAAMLAEYERESVRCGRTLSLALDRLVPVLESAMSAAAGSGQA